MRKIIKKILREEVNLDHYPVEVGSTYKINVPGQPLVRISKIDYHDRFKGRLIGKKNVADQPYDIINDGYYVSLDKSRNGGKNWEKGIGSIELKWASHLIHIGFWIPVVDYDETDKLWNDLDPE